jgi:phospholipid/cholesterol/gamma-HCH transport system substrate-binding protein
MKKENLEFRVGIFVVAGLTLLSVLVFRAGDFYMKPGFNIRIVFDYVSGVDKGSPVRLAGVNVGDITQITIIKDANGLTQAELTARIREGVYIEEDAEARINTLGILGEKYVEILPGTAGANPLRESSVLVGKNPLIIANITEAGSRLIAKLDMTVDSVNKIVSDQAFQESIRGTFDKSHKTFASAEVVAKNMIEMTDDLKETAKSARIVMERLKNGEGTVGRLLTNETIAKDLEAFVKDIKTNPWKLLKKG